MFLDHCLRGTKLRYLEKSARRSTFISFHAKGSPTYTNGMSAWPSHQSGRLTTVSTSLVLFRN